MTITIFVIAVLGFGILIYLQLSGKKSGVDQQEFARLRVGLDQKTEECGRMKSKIDNARSDKDKLEEKGKALFSRFKDLESDHKALLMNNDELKKRITEYEASEESRLKEMDERLQKLHRAEKSLEDEKVRIRREDEERQKQIVEERDRQWSEHEQEVAFDIIKHSKDSEMKFDYYDNKNLPDGFDGSIKPDNMISFLGQYVVFDAKVSRSENFRNYIKVNVKETAKKYKGHAEIYPTIFFVVPTDAISELDDLVYREGSFTFHIISREALAPILTSFKKITTYEFAEQMDPQERENIIHLIASLDHHISERNAYDVLVAQRGSQILYDAKGLYPDMSEKVEQEKKKMRYVKFKDADIKRLASDPKELKKFMQELVSPKPEVDVKEVKKALLDAG